MSSITPIELSDKSTDYPEYRGRNRDAIVIGLPLARDWKAHLPRLLWRQPCGGGYSSSGPTAPSYQTPTPGMGPTPTPGGPGY